MSGPCRILPTPEGEAIFSDNFFCPQNSNSVALTALLTLLDVPS